MDDDIFDEMNHWLRFIEQWKKESDEPVPEKALCALEIALDKAITDYKRLRLFSITKDKSDVLH